MNVKNKFNLTIPLYSNVNLVRSCVLLWKNLSRATYCLCLVIILHWWSLIALFSQSVTVSHNNFSIEYNVWLKCYFGPPISRKKMFWSPFPQPHFQNRPPISLFSSSEFSSLISFLGHFCWFGLFNIRPLFADMDILCGHISSATSLVNRLMSKNYLKMGTGWKIQKEKKKWNWRPKNCLLKWGTKTSFLKNRGTKSASKPICFLIWFSYDFCIHNFIKSLCNYP